MFCHLFVEDISLQISSHCLCTRILRLESHKSKTAVNKTAVESVFIYSFANIVDGASWILVGFRVIAWFALFPAWMREICLNLFECVKWIPCVMREKHKFSAWNRANLTFPAWFLVIDPVSIKIVRCCAKSPIFLSMCDERKCVWLRDWVPPGGGRHLCELKV